MSKELALPVELRNGLRPLTREEYNELIYQGDSAGKSKLDTYLEEAADAYENSHPFLKILKDFVPGLGIATDLLEAYKNKKRGVLEKGLMTWYTV